MSSHVSNMFEYTAKKIINDKIVKSKGFVDIDLIMGFEDGMIFYTDGTIYCAEKAIALVEQYNKIKEDLSTQEKLGGI